MLFKELLSNAISKRKLTLNDVAILSEVKVSKVEMYLKGAVPSEQDEIKICEALQIDPDDITYDELNMSINEARTLMQKDACFVKNAIEKERLPGSYVKRPQSNRYHIPRIAFMKYMEEWHTNSALQEQVNELSKTIGNLNSMLSRLYETVLQERK